MIIIYLLILEVAVSTGLSWAVLVSTNHSQRQLGLLIYLCSQTSRTSWPGLAVHNGLCAHPRGPPFSGRPAWVWTHGEDEVLRESVDMHKTSRDLGSELAMATSAHILMVKASHKFSPDSGNGEINSTSPCGELPSPLQRVWIKGNY